MYWANVLHIYQPVTQDENVIHKVVKESYEPLVLGILKTPSVRITLNINAVLTEWFDRLGYQRLIEALGQAGKRGQIEFLTSAKYHALLPLIPLEEARRQLELNVATNRRFFGPIYEPVGVFLPEMAYSPEIGRLVAEMGYKYLIMDEIGYQNNLKVKSQKSKVQVKSQNLPIHYDKLYTLKGYPDFTIFFRHRGASDAISFGKIRTGEGLVRAITSRANPEDHYVITALDGETFGHHRREFDRVLFAAYDLLRAGPVPGFPPVSARKLRAAGSPSTRATRPLTPVLLRELLHGSPNEEVEPLACSWSTQAADLVRGIPFALWNDPGNPVHRWQWELVKLALHEMKKENIKKKKDEEKAQYEEARELLDQALHSDQFWWASGFEIKRGGKNYVFWSREMIERGAKLFVDTIASIPAISAQTIAEARDLYLAVNESAERYEKFLKKTRRVKI